MKRTQLILLTLVIAFAGCKKNDAVLKGTSPNTDFDHLYNSLHATAGYVAETSIDVEVHSYSFEVKAPHTITSIGYQSLPNFNTTPYLFEIYDSTSRTLLYSGYHTFSPSVTSYVTITPVALVPGHLYSVKRIQRNWVGYIGNTIGKIIMHRLPNDVVPIPFPKSYGDLIITGSSFYDRGGPINNTALPYIDLVYN